MPLLELPHTPGCLVCGRDNPVGLHLSLFVDPDTGTVHTTFTPAAHHIGFEGILHGGILATVLDEAMVWAAIWQAKRACVAGELSVRFRSPGRVGTPLTCTARVVSARSRLLETTGELTDSGGLVVATGTAKYVPLSPDTSAGLTQNFIRETNTAAAIDALRASTIPQ